MKTVYFKKISHLFFAFLLLVNPALADKKKFQFENITTRDGLSDNDISSINNDGRGFIWLGTNEGLNKFDGYGFQVYNSNPFDTTALSGNRIWDIYEDKSGDIWSSTDKSLDLYIYGNNAFHRFTTNSRPTFVTEDKEGLLWVATENNGLFSIDKKTKAMRNFVRDPSDPFSISSSSFSPEQFNPIVVDTAGNIWVGTSNGLNYYRKEKEAFTNFTTLRGLSNNKINTLYLSNDELYIGTPTGLDKININSMEITNLAGSYWMPSSGAYGVNKILDLGDNLNNMQGFWMATDGGLFFYNEAYQLFDEIYYDHFIGQYITNVYRDHNNHLWVDVLQYGGAVYFNTDFYYQNSYSMYSEDEFSIYQPNSTGTMEIVEEPSLVEINTQIKDLFVDDLNNLWVATQVGLNRLVQTTQNFTSYTPSSSALKGANIKSVKIAKDNSIWVAHEKGLDHLSSDYKLVKSYKANFGKKNSLISDETSALAFSPNDMIWVGSQLQGVTVINPKNNKLYQIRSIEEKDQKNYSTEEYTRYAVNKILDGDKNLINSIENNDPKMATNVSKMIDAIERGARERPPMPDAIKLGGMVNSIYSDGNTMWLSSRDGIAKTSYKPNKNEFLFSVFTYSKNNDKKFLQNPTAFLLDNNTNEMWVGTESNGLFRINPNSMQSLEHYLLDKDNDKSFSSSGVKDIHQSKDGTIWIGSTGEGIYRYNSENNNFDRWSTKDGLPSNTVLSISSDTDNSIWLGTRRGVVRRLENGNFQSFESTDGLPADIFNDRSIARDGKGKIYFGSIAGLTVVKPQSIVTNNRTPKLAISSVEALDFDGNKNPVNFLGNKLSVKRRDVQSININFVGLTYNKSAKNQYQYRVENHLDSWVQNGTNRSVSLQGLGDGDFIFQFKASNNDGIWTETPYSLSLEVIPPWYSTWYAYALYVLSTIGVGAFAFVGVDKLRVKAREDQRKDEELAQARDFQLKMIAKEIPDFEGMSIQAYMRTSTEVGGDYYDFFELEDGSFYVVCGDATGHGSQSGMMVSITKAGLAGIVSDSPDVILHRLNNVVRRVDTGRLRMSLSVCIFRNNKLFISAAAMPPAYLYREETKEVEEIEIHNLPLGGLDNESFDLIERDFDKGDLLVLLSDGLPEAPNPKGNLLDYPAVLKCIEETGHLGAAPVKEALIKLADEWLNGVQTPDDITFVVLEKRSQVANLKKVEPVEQSVKKIAQA